MEQASEQTPQEFFQDIASRGKQYFMVFLKTGPNRNQDEATAMQIQIAHLKHLFALRDQGVLAINGPVTDESEIIGVSIYNSSDVEQVKQWVEADPAIKSGRIIYEIHPWFSFPGDKLP